MALRRDAVRLQGVIPLLRVFDPVLARDFYEGYLGFGWDWESPLFEGSPLYAQVSRDDAIIHLTGHHGDGTPGTHVLIWMRGVDALRQELLAHESSFSRPGIEDNPWGRTLEVIDPFDNHLNLTEPVRGAR